MAHDLATTPTSGLQGQVRLCGDAHIANFGIFNSPERRQVFDLNDFDETAPGPFEWTVKRLAASIQVAGRENGPASQVRSMVTGAIGTYCDWMATYSEMTQLDIWYAKLDVTELMALLNPSSRSRKRTEANLRRQRPRTTSKRWTS